LTKKQLAGKMHQLSFSIKEAQLKAGRCVIVIVLAAVIILIFVKAAVACQPDIYYLFSDEARVRLEELEGDTSQAAEWQRIVLMHNLGFNRDKNMRKKAEGRMKAWQKNNPMTPLQEAYLGSLQMLRVSQRSTLSNFWGVITDNSPKNEAEDGFRRISAALAEDSSNIVIRFLRLTAALESIDQLDGKKRYARKDLDWLDGYIDRTDSAQVFLFHLSRVKYYFYELRHIQGILFHYESELYYLNPDLVMSELLLAAQFSCCPFYKSEIELWTGRLIALFPKYFQRTSAP